MSEVKPKDAEFLKAVGTALLLIGIATAMWSSLSAAFMWGFGLEVKSWGWLIGGLAVFNVARSVNRTILKRMGWSK
jgi:hypothetical protein